MRKRGFTRHDYTVARNTVVDDSNPVYEYKRGTGQITPSTTLSKAQDTGVQLELKSEITIMTKEDYPTIDRFGGLDGKYGITFKPDLVMWSGVPYVVYGQNLWPQNNKNSYREVIALFSSAESYDQQGLRELDWKEIDGFQAAVNSVEFANTLLLDKVLED